MFKIEQGEITTKKKPVNFEKKEKDCQKCDCKDKRQYGLNKSLVKKKIFAFYHLPKKAKYFRLWTLTYPAGTNDDICYKIHNNFLTRLRTELGLKDYIWIAERQQNGTLHFHFIFSQFIDITKANNYVKKAVNNSIKRGEIEGKKGIYENYNGLDVSKKCGNFNTVCKYLTKYVTKNNTKSERLPYYCSTSISRLFTTMILDINEVENLINSQKLEIKKAAIFENEYCQFFGVKKINIQEIFGKMFALNEIIYEM